MRAPRPVEQVDGELDAVAAVAALHARRFDDLIELLRTANAQRLRWVVLAAVTEFAAHLEDCGSVPDVEQWLSVWRAESLDRLLPREDGER